MKQIRFYFIVLLVLLLTSCTRGQKNQSDKQLEITPVMVENNRWVGYAYMLPQGWKGEGSVKNYFHTSLTPLLTIQATNPKKEASLYASKLGYYYYSDAQYRSMMQMNQMMQAQMPSQGFNNIAVPSPKFPENFRPLPPSIEQYTNQQLLPYFMNEYEVTNQRLAPELMLKKHKETQSIILLTEMTHSSDPTQRATVYTIFSVFQNSMPNSNGGIVDYTSWEPIIWIGKSNVKDKTETDNALKLALNTIEINPIYENYIEQINQRMMDSNMRNAQALSAISRSVSDHFRNTLHSVQANSNAVRNNLSQQRSDVMLDVTTYTDSNGEEYRLPSSNEYYYSNSVNDFLGSNSPLFDPNSNLSSLYNWEKLQKKY